MTGIELCRRFWAKFGSDEDALKNIGLWDELAAELNPRDHALEQAARLVERYCDSPMNVQIAGAAAAQAIRALKLTP